MMVTSFPINGSSMKFIHILVFSNSFEYVFYSWEISKFPNIPNNIYF